MKTPKEVKNFADNLVVYVHKATGNLLDNTPETLPFLDFYCQIFREERNSILKPASTNKNHKMQQIAKLIAPMAGAYFGIIVCRKYRCRWYAPKGDYKRWRIQFDNCFLYFNPISISMEILTQQELDDWNSAFITNDKNLKILKEMLDRWDWVTKEDYFSFMIRWEILDQIASILLLAENLNRKTRTPKLYTSKDYDEYAAMKERRNSKISADSNDGEGQGRFDKKN